MTDMPKYNSQLLQANLHTWQQHREPKSNDNGKFCTDFVATHTQYTFCCVPGFLSNITLLKHLCEQLCLLGRQPHRSTQQALHVTVTKHGSTAQCCPLYQVYTTPYVLYIQYRLEWLGKNRFIQSAKELAKTLQFKRNSDFLSTYSCRHQ